MNDRLPSYYTDEEWNQLTPGERQEAQITYSTAFNTLSPLDVEGILSRLDEEADALQPLDSPENYHDWCDIQREIESWLSFLEDLQAENEDNDETKDYPF